MILSADRLSDNCAEFLKPFGLKNGIDDQNSILQERVLLGARGSIRRALRQGMPNLEVIQTFTAGVDDLPFDLIPQNVKIFSNAGVFSQSVSEHALALVLALSKNVSRREPSVSYGIKDKTLVVLGCGGIGSTVAAMAKNAFGCKVIGISRSFKIPENFDERFGVDQLENALGTADILISALPLNKFTRNLLRYDDLSKTKRNSIIVNVGRAEAINEPDIYRLLIENPGIRFGTDVFWFVGEKENFDSKLWQLPNFMGTMHRAGGHSSPEVMEQSRVTAVKNVRSYMLTSTAQNLVRRDDYV
jgi:D-3-phosphoglycerate dehydrogenase / 2-oxoglutarate reductase